MTALISPMACMNTCRTWDILIEAEDMSYYLLGRNGDIWQNIFDRLDERRSQGITDINVIKAKSHVTSQEEWVRYGMARQGQITRADPSCTSLLKDDSQAKHELHMIANRIATAEASIWNTDDTSEKFEGSNFDKLIEQTALQIKRKAFVALDNTAGGEGHDLYVDRM